MPWEQLTFSFEPKAEAEAEAEAEPGQAAAPARAIPPREPDEFDAWVHRRSEFDKAFLRGMRMSAEQTMTNIKRGRA